MLSGGGDGHRFRADHLDEDDIFNQSQELKFDSVTISQLAILQTPPSNLIKKIEIQAMKADEERFRNNNKKKQAPIPSVIEDTTQEDGLVAMKLEDGAKGTFIHKEDVTKENSVGRSGLKDGLNKEKKPSRLWKMRVYLHCVDAHNGADVTYLKMQVPFDMSVESVIIECLKQYNLDQRKPPLVQNAMFFELRTCAEEEDEDEDEDSIVLDRKREIGQCGFKIVSLNKASDVSDADIILTEQAAAGGDKDYPAFQIKKDGKKGLFRVMMEGESHVVQFTKEQTMDKLLVAVAKKRKEKMTPEEFEFFKIEDGSVIDWYTIAGDLETDNIGLRKKHEEKQELRVIHLSSEQAPQPSDFLFTKETASIYKEYEVIKHKSRTKKQLRIMGIDEEKIYNLPPENNVEASSLSLRILSLGPVKRRERDISDVISAEVIRGRMFRVIFRDLKTNAIVPYEYEAASNYECAEIVAKLEFLRKHI
jgi:hypothetical protein